MNYFLSLQPIAFFTVLSGVLAIPRGTVSQNTLNTLTFGFRIIQSTTKRFPHIVHFVLRLFAFSSFAAFTRLQLTAN